VNPDIVKSILFAPMIARLFGLGCHLEVIRHLLHSNRSGGFSRVGAAAGWLTL
jgi:hypothetical protein